MATPSSTRAVPEAGRTDTLARLLEDLEVLPLDEVWRVRNYAGLRRLVLERRGLGEGLCELICQAAGLAPSFLALLDGRSLAKLGASGRQWRELPHWAEHWFLLGVQDFGKHRRLVPPGRFERFDEAMLDSRIDWHERYRNFQLAVHCPSLESLRMAAVRVVQAIDLETSGLEEVRRRLAAELQLGQQFLSLECVEQLLEDASSLRSVGGRRAGAGEDRERGEGGRPDEGWTPEPFEMMDEDVGEL